MDDNQTINNLVEIQSGLVSKNLFAKLEATLPEMETFLILDDYIPTFVNESEYEKVLDGVFDTSKFILIDIYLLNKNFIENVCFDKCSETILKAAENDAFESFKNKGQVLVENKPKTSKKKGKKRGKKNVEEEEDTIENTSKCSTLLPS